MGINESAVNHGYLTEQDVKVFTDKSYFKRKEILILAAKYREIAKDSKITAESFAKAFNISNMQLATIMFRIIDSDGDGNLSFTEFIEGLNKIHPHADFSQKVSLCFNAYDSDGSGSVSEEEISSVIKISLQDNSFITLTESQINDLSERLIKKYDKNDSGELTYNEFYNMVSNAPGIIERFTLDIDDLF